MLKLIVLLMLIISISTVNADDMGANEAILMNTTTNAIWAKRAIIKMGNNPFGTATPGWWMPANSELKSDKPWEAIVPWFVIYPGINHNANNVRVKVSDIRISILLKSTGEWTNINTGDGKPVWASNYKFNLGSSTGKAYPRIEPDNQLSYKLTTSFNPIHGSKSRYNLIANGINPSDIDVVKVSAKTQLIQDDINSFDDRASAQILFSIGADYYPKMTSTISDLYPMKSYPGVGGSNYGIIKTQPRVHYFSTR